MKEAPKKLLTARLVVIHVGKLLLAFSKRKQAFYLPCGKLDEGESPAMALLGEIKEELSIEIAPEELDFYYHIAAPAYGEDPPVTMEQDCFLYTLISTPVVNAEIETVRFFSFREFKEQAVQVPGVLLLFEQLVKDDKVYPV